jgi:hypothetical protein
MPHGVVTIDFDYRIHDLMTGYQNSFCGTYKVPPDFFPTICYTECLPAIPNTLFCKNSCNAIGIITIIAKLAVEGFELFNRFYVFKSTQSCFNIHDENNPFQIGDGISMI